jgi:hypothetical protein
MDQYFKETVNVKVKGNYDVIVAGGGIAGVAAAIAAARHGCKTLLVEKTISLGGLATNGLVLYYNPSLCDRKGRKIIGGISEELLHASIKYGRSTLPPEWKFRTSRVDTDGIYQTKFSAASFVAALDEIIDEAGVMVLFDTVCCAVKMKDGVCDGVIIENKEGRVFYGCRQLIDTTGDLDLFQRAGASCINDLNWLSFWILDTDMDRLKACCEAEDIGEAIEVKMLGTDRDGLRNPPGVRRYKIESGEEVSEFIRGGRRYFLEYLKRMDVKKQMAVLFPSQAQYRTTRHIQSEYILEQKDKNVHRDDSIGCAYTFREDGFFVEVPYNALTVKGYKNMITAGRTIGSIGIVCELTRLIAPSAMTGEAAGIAVSLAMSLGCDINEVPLEKLQCAIVEADGILHF